MQKKLQDVWVDELLTQLASGKQYRRLIQRCIDKMDVTGKRLYKYYSFNSEYTVQNIENSIVYYSDPTTFNDPFDCNVGISVDQFFRLYMPNLFEQVNPNISQEEQRIITSLMCGNNDDEIDPDSKEAFLAECITNDNFSKLLQKSRSGKPISNQEIMELLSQSPEIVASMVKHCMGKTIDFSDMDPAKLTQIIFGSMNMVRNMLLEDPVFSKSDAAPMLDIIAGENDFLTRILELAKITGNDIPEDKIKQLYDGINGGIQTIHHQIGSLVGVSCFTETPYNMLMWSHYADKHSGICVEYDFSKLFSSAPNSLLLPVKYSKKRPLLHIEKIMEINDGNIQTNNDKMHLLLPDILKSLSIKSSIWEYEREWRHIVFTKDAPERKVHLPIVSKIIMGINISEENKIKIEEIATKHKIPLLKAGLKSDKYEMIISE